MLLQRILQSALLLTSVLGKPHRNKNSDQHGHKKRQWTGDPSGIQGIYDYVVVGAGAGGAPLACRLARAGFTVLLIDAGSDTSGFTDYLIPSYHPRASELPEHAWSYYVSRQANPADVLKDPKVTYAIPDDPAITDYAGDRPPAGGWYYRKPDGLTYTGYNPPPGAEPLGLYYPRGSALGGSTSMSAMAMVYPFEQDWDYIQSITGNVSWNHQYMREYFVRLEKCRYQINSIAGHGFDGWLNIGITPLTLIGQDAKLISLVVAAATAVGKGFLGGLISTVTGLTHIFAEDLNAPGRTRDQDQNIWQVPISIDPSTSYRSGVVDFVHQTVAEGYPLFFQPYTFATKILFDTSGGRPRAIGVEYRVGPHIYSASPLRTGDPGIPGYVYARREVIVSCGAFESPKLLKLSGIGPPDELAAFGIPSLVPLQGVGSNLQDRYEVGVVGQADTPFTVFGPCTYSYSQPDPCLEQFQQGTVPIGKGPYTSNGLALGTTMSSSTNPTDINDIFIVAVPAWFSGYYNGYARAAVLDARTWTFVVLKVQTQNRDVGTVTLRSANPLDMPNIAFNYFAANGAADLQSVVEAIERSRHIFDSVIPIDGAFTEAVPGRQFQGPDLAEWARTYAWGHHASCTCRIGPPEDPLAVIDGDFRVYGVDGLRVVDASSFPNTPGYYPTIAIYMISEKAADVILGQPPPPINSFNNIDAGGFAGTLGAAIPGILGGLTDPDIGPAGLLGTFGSLLGGPGLAGLANGNPPQKRGWLESVINPALAGKATAELE